MGPERSETDKRLLAEFVHTELVTCVTVSVVTIIALCLVAAASGEATVIAGFIFPVRWISEHRALVKRIDRYAPELRDDDELRFERYLKNRGIAHVVPIWN